MRLVTIRQIPGASRKWTVNMSARILDDEEIIEDRVAILLTHAQVKVLEAAGVTETYAEAYRGDTKACWYVEQVFLPGAPVIRTRKGEPDRLGNVATYRPETGGGYRIRCAGADMHVVRDDGAVVSILDGNTDLQVPFAAIDFLIEALGEVRSEIRRREIVMTTTWKTDIDFSVEDWLAWAASQNLDASIRCFIEQRGFSGASPAQWVALANVGLANGFFDLPDASRETITRSVIGDQATDAYLAWAK